MDAFNIRSDQESDEHGQLITCDLAEWVNLAAILAIWGTAIFWVQSFRLSRGQVRRLRLRFRFRQNSFVQNIAETYSTQIATVALGLFTSVAVARALGPAGRGLYGAALAVGMLGI